MQTIEAIITNAAAEHNTIEATIVVGTIRATVTLINGEDGPTTTGWDCVDQWIDYCNAIALQKALDCECFEDLAQEICDAVESAL